MIHFLPDAASDATAPSASLARLSGLNQALAAVEGLSGRTADPSAARAIAAAWPVASRSQQGQFDTLSAQAVAGAAAGLEAIAALREAGMDANRAATEALCGSIRAEFARLGLVFSL